MKTAVAYTRVSTSRQGKSGLGLEAQLSALARFAEAEGFELVETYKEVETGKGADALDRRPQLAAALKAARRQADRSIRRRVRPETTGLAGTTPNMHMMQS
jgi:DNA invertase Pin-like site-specific DNA recombinase